ncbi:MAG: nucleotidyltransferase domain-containing protein [Desulfohalobiaceae bacterium]|nr:nucleotidyltransferase domain-containing protein [Desulfohalobiaceae bacterium]
MTEAICQVLAEFEPGILFAYVFGSHGTALEHPGSDLDIAVYFDLPASCIELDQKLRLYTELSRATRKNEIDVLVLNTCSNDMLLFELMTQVRVIYDVAPEVRSLFEQRTLHKAIDFKEQRERILG